MRPVPSAPVDAVAATLNRQDRYAGSGWCLLKDTDRASRVRSPREPPLTPTSSVDTSGAPVAPVVGTDRASHIFAVSGKRVAMDLPLRRLRTQAG